MGLLKHRRKSLTAILNQWAVDFDGVNDYCLGDSQPSAISDRNFTVSIWADLDISDGNTATLWGTSTAISFNLAREHSSYYVTTSNDGGNFAVSIRGFIGNNDRDGSTVQFENVGNFSSYTNIIVTMNGQTTQLFVNGVFKGSGVGSDFPVSDFPLESFRGFNIGSYHNGGTGSLVMNGKIDEVSVWSVPFTVSHAVEVFNGGSPGNLNSHSQNASLQSWFRMGDSEGGTGSTISDEVGSVTLTLTNGASFTQDVP